MYLEPKAEFRADLHGRLAQPARLPLRAEHARRELDRREGAVRLAAAVREPPRRPELPARQHGRGDRHRALVRPRRRHAGGAARRSAGCSAPTSRSKAGRYKIARIYDAESWNPDLRAPLAAPGVDVKVGDFIVAINGAELKAPDNIYRLLDGTANRQTVLAVNSRPVLDGRAAGDGDPGRQRADAAHARVGRGEPPPGRQAVERPARLRPPAEHRAARLPELQPLLLRAAGQEGGDHRRALQRRRLGGRLHHRRPAARLRRLLQQRRRRSRALHEPGARASGGRR